MASPEDIFKKVSEIIRRGVTAAESERVYLVLSPKDYSYLLALERELNE